MSLPTRGALAQVPHGQEHIISWCEFDHPSRSYAFLQATSPASCVGGFRYLDSMHASGVWQQNSAAVSTIQSFSAYVMAWSGLRVSHACQQIHHTSFTKLLDTSASWLPGNSGQLQGVVLCCPAQCRIHIGARGCPP